MPLNSILPQQVKTTYLQEITFIRNCANNNHIKISSHCYKQIAERNIKLKDVYDSIRNGVVIEIQNFERDVKILFQDSNNIPPIFFVSVALKSTFGLCVTAYIPDPDKWILDSSNQWRRK